MLKNTAVRKAVIGLLNSSKDKIVTVLNPWVEPAAANTKIK